MSVYNCISSAFTRRIPIIAMTVLLSASARADVKPAAVFTDHMILQRDAPIPIWGTAYPGEKISVSFRKQKVTTKAGSNGRWMVALQPELAGGPFTLAISGRNNVSFSDVLVGEVWVCSGQSNMEFPLKSAMNAETEISAADYPMIRQLTVPRHISMVPLNDMEATEWKPCSPQTAGSFSAVAYFFAKQLWEELKIPVGLIHSSWGGTNIETWTSREALAKHPDFAPLNSAPKTFAAINLAKREKILDVVRKFQGDLNSSDKNKWQEQHYNDVSWGTLITPQFWESQGLPDFDGTVWYRKRFKVSAADAGKEAVLELGKVDDSDITWINGVKLGESLNMYQVSRMYKVPAGLLKPGENTIAVKVNDTGVGGGIYSTSDSMQIITAGKARIPLSGQWKAKVDTGSIAFVTGGPNVYPSLLFNAMLNPIIPYTIRGAIWYQGESNVDRAEQYRSEFPLMISDWRQRWGLGDFPFYFVQLSSFDPRHTDALKEAKWAELREAQTEALKLPNTGMAVTTDIGNVQDVHPTNKQDVGLRLALQALHGTYGKKIVYQGPAFRSASIEDKTMVVSFDTGGSDIVIRNKYDYVKGFQLAGSDRKFHWAQGRLQNGKIILTSDSVPQPVYVRYNWANDAIEGNVFNSEELPAAPFRNDELPFLTQGNKYNLAH
ncbi:sialate O-acetylesterase [Desertivirga xinjiangensis]|uniref:sialate O-acetylesterase n=1 Tax=Desertivirga xinjiangensis TaxID=539206 RepID=UPI00210F227A|nr:sialate O-acetylesterase [Pedobacter xinjiangensis]